MRRPCLLIALVAVAGLAAGCAAAPDRVGAMARLYDTWAARTGVKPWIGEQTEIGWPDPVRYTK
jgi:hypothetical protein